MIDVFGKDASILKKKKLFLFDMDGTIYEEETVFDGTIDLLQHIKNSGGNYVFITNNSSKGIEDYLSKMKRLGIEADVDNFFTSTQATALLFNKRYEGKKIYCQGTRSMIKELLSSGVDITEQDEKVDAVLVGFDTELTSEKIRRTCRILSTQDVPFYATNPDLRCPVEFGFIPDCGSICQMIINATDKIPTYIGKPEPVMVNVAMEKFGRDAEETVVIGDRLYTDIATGFNADVTAVCVLTGEATISEIENGRIKPTLTFESVRDIAKIIR